MNKFFARKKSGFTLLEMSIVLFIISLLILIILPNLAKQRDNANRIHRHAMVAVVQTQVDAYENETGTNKVTLEDLRQHDYLTSAQVDKAHKEHISIENGRVISR